MALLKAVGLLPLPGGTMLPTLVAWYVDGYAMLALIASAAAAMLLRRRGEQRAAP